MAARSVTYRAGSESDLDFGRQMTDKRVRLPYAPPIKFIRKENLTFFIFYDIINIENEKEIKGNQLLPFKLLDIIPTKVF